MDRSKYMQTQIALIQIAQASIKLDLPEFIEAVERAEQMAPHPKLPPHVTKFGGQQLGNLKRLAQSVLKLQIVAQDVIKTQIAQRAEQPERAD